MEARGRRRNGREGGGGRWQRRYVLLSEEYTSFGAIDCSSVLPSIVLDFATHFNFRTLSRRNQIPRWPYASQTQPTSNPDSSVHLCVSTYPLLSTSAHRDYAGSQYGGQNSPRAAPYYSQHLVRLGNEALPAQHLVHTSSSYACGAFLKGNRTSTKVYGELRQRPVPFRPTSTSPQSKGQPARVARPPGALPAIFPVVSRVPGISDLQPR